MCARPETIRHTVALKLIACIHIIPGLSIPATAPAWCERATRHYSHPLISGYENGLRAASGVATEKLIALF